MELHWEDAEVLPYGGFAGFVGKTTLPLDTVVGEHFYVLL
jgi:hypothetical protein